MKSQTKPKSAVIKMCDCTPPKKKFKGFQGLVSCHGGFQSFSEELTLFFFFIYLFNSHTLKELKPVGTLAQKPEWSCIKTSGEKPFLNINEVAALTY